MAWNFFKKGEMLLEKTFSNDDFAELKSEFKKSIYEEYMCNQPVRDGKEICDFLNDVSEERKNEHEL